MEQREITSNLLTEFQQYLRNNEKSKATIEKYTRDVRCFLDFTHGTEISKEIVLSYKAILEKEYALSSANSMIAAVNTFLRFREHEEMCVKQFRVQKQVFSQEEKELTKEEYFRLIQTANERGNKRLSLIIQTICGTGIRVSELEYVTVEAVRRGEAFVSCKAKARVVFIVSALQVKLLEYAREQGIRKGAIFITRNGQPMNRSNVWREMKEICDIANVSHEKVFPHNLRHLFARTFYGMDKDIAKLADILGHSNINTTRIYIVTTGAEHRRKMEGMELVM